MITLALDAATYTGTVAILDGAAILFECEAPMRGERQERLMPAVAAAIEGAAVEGADVQRIVCGAGPGSFTSLRIAASIAKGLATAWSRPLFAVSSLGLIVAGAATTLTPGRYAAAIDALRGETYVAMLELDAAGSLRAISPPERVATRDLSSLAAQMEARLIGPGQALDVKPHARGVAQLEAAIFAVDLSSWEPSYGRLAEAQVKWEAAHGRPLPRP